MELAATEEKEITVTYEIVADIPKMISYVYMNLFFSLKRKITYIYIISYFTYHYLSMHCDLKVTNIFLVEWMHLSQSLLYFRIWGKILISTFAKRTHNRLDALKWTNNKMHDGTWNCKRYETYSIILFVLCTNRTWD